MRARREVLGLLAALALAAATIGSASAQVKNGSGGSPGAGTDRSSGPSEGGYRRGGPGLIGPGVIMSIPRSDAAPARQSKRASAPRAARQGPGATPAGDGTMVPNEVLVEVPNSVTAQTLDAIARRHRLTLLERQTFQFSGSTLVRWRITDRRSVAAVVRELERDSAVASVQPNFLYALRQNADGVPTEGDPMQYEIAKLHLAQAHTLATGANVLVGVVDTGVDAAHPELAGSIAGTFDAVEFLPGLNKHGTSIAGLIAAHKTLMGAAPKARILSARVLGPNGIGGTFNILRGLDWAAANGARVINMSFTGPADPATRRFVEFAYNKGIVLVACSGNAGAKSPPLYPSAYPTVIAVSATDARDNLFEPSNRGRHVAVAAPGADILVAIPNGAFEIASGTSLSAAEVTGVAALILERKPDLNPDQVRAILQSTARDLGPKGQDPFFGAGLVNAHRALLAETPPPVAKAPEAVERVITGGR
jgi:subtilisin family serine protease